MKGFAASVHGEFEFSFRAIPFFGMLYPPQSNWRWWNKCQDLCGAKVLVLVVGLDC
jgi:hypothetical protein